MALIRERFPGSSLILFDERRKPMHELTAFVSNLNSVLWGPFCLIPLLVGTGIYFSFKLRFVQVRRFGRAASYVLRHVKFFGNKADGSGMSSFQSLATAIAAQVGTGNLAGVDTALAMGGPRCNLLDVACRLFRHGNHLRRSRPGAAL